MKAKKPRKARPPKAQDDPKQSERFIEAAKAAEADESPDALDKAFDHLAQVKRA